MDVQFSLLLEDWYIVLETMSQRDTEYTRGWSPCLRVYKLISLTETEVFPLSNPQLLPAQGAEREGPNQMGQSLSLQCIRNKAWPRSYRRSVRYED